MKQCPVCRESISESQIICTQCYGRTLENESPRRESVLYSWGRGLLIFLAGFFFIRGMYALLDPAGYRSAGLTIGISVSSDTIHYLNATVLLLTGIIYGISWLGGYLEKKWHRTLCLSALIIFCIGQLIVQFAGVTDGASFARGLALVFLWITLPIFQYTAFAMGTPYSLPVPEGDAQETVSDNKDETSK